MTVVTDDDDDACTTAVTVGRYSSGWCMRACVMCCVSLPKVPKLVTVAGKEYNGIEHHPIRKERFIYVNSRSTDTLHPVNPCLPVSSSHNSLLVVHLSAALGSW